MCQLIINTHRISASNNIWINFFQPIHVSIIFKALDVINDKEICELIGVADVHKLTPTLEECHNLKIYTQEAALKYLGSKLVAKRYVTAASKTKTPTDEARDVLANTILAHVPVENYNFRLKAIYLAIMVNLPSHYV